MLPHHYVNSLSGWENSGRSKDQLDCRIYWIPPTHERKNGEVPSSRAPKIVLYKYSAQKTGVVCKSRPRVPEFTSPRVPMFPWPTFPRPRVSMSPSPRVLASSRRTSSRPKSPRPTFHVPVPRLVTAGMYTALNFTVKPSEAYPSRLHQWTDYLKLEPASRFKNAIMNWLFEYWTRSFDPRIGLTGSISEKSIQHSQLQKRERTGTSFLY